MSVELRAPKNKIRVIGVDTFDNSSWIQGDFETYEEANIIATKEGGTMTKMHIYDDQGRHLGEAGTF